MVQYRPYGFLVANSSVSIKHKQVLFQSLYPWVAKLVKSFGLSGNRQKSCRLSLHVKAISPVFNLDKALGSVSKREKGNRHDRLIVENRPALWRA
jgi:hypothetical protein